MSLFPAYLDDVQKSDSKEPKEEEEDWLENKSFPNRLLSSSSKLVSFEKSLKLL